MNFCTLRTSTVNALQRYNQRAASPIGLGAILTFVMMTPIISFTNIVVMVAPKENLEKRVASAVDVHT
jgi:hypothetical protein